MTVPKFQDGGKARKFSLGCSEKYIRMAVPKTPRLSASQSISPRQRRQNPRPAAHALVEAREVKLLVRRMHAVIIEREADHERVHAKHALEVGDDRDRAAL